MKVFGDDVRDNPVGQYRISDSDDASDPSYYGFVGPQGNWYILKITSSTGSFRYCKGSTCYSTAWGLRADPATVYGYFNTIF